MGLGTTEKARLGKGTPFAYSFFNLESEFVELSCSIFFSNLIYVRVTFCVGVNTRTPDYKPCLYTRGDCERWAEFDCPPTGQKLLSTILFLCIARNCPPLKCVQHARSYQNWYVSTPVRGECLGRVEPSH